MFVQCTYLFEMENNVITNVNYTQKHVSMYACLCKRECGQRLNNFLIILCKL